MDGDINAPSEFLKHRGTLHKKEECHFIFEREKNFITLILDEKSHEGGKIVGKLLMNKEIEALGINTDKMMGHKDVLNLLKFTKHLFATPEKHKKLMDDLKSLKVKIDAEFKDQGDQRGNQNTSLTTKTTTNIALDFTLQAPIYKGFGNRKFKVDIFFEAHSAQNLQFWFESEEFQQLIVNEKEEIFNKKKEEFKDYVVIEK